MRRTCSVGKMIYNTLTVIGREIGRTSACRTDAARDQKELAGMSAGP